MSIDITRSLLRERDRVSFKLVKRKEVERKKKYTDEACTYKYVYTPRDSDVPTSLFRIILERLRAVYFVSREQAVYQNASKRDFPWT